MVKLLQIGLLERGILIVVYITLAMVVRKYLNKHSLKYSSVVLWGIVLLRLSIPYTILFQIPKQQNGIAEMILFPMIFMSKIIEYLSKHLSAFLPEVNRVIVMAVLLIYVVSRVLNMSRALKNAHEIELSKKLQRYLMKTVPIKRKVKVFINNDLRAPVTYGIFSPKIILQDRIIEDKTILKYVLVHEMTHIKKFDMVWNHLKNIIVCIYWYNPFVWLMSNYITEDLEVLCDKLVVERTGNREQNKLEYMHVMFQVLTQGRQKEKLKTVDATMKLNPTVERMVILKNMQIRKAGVVLMLATLMLSITAFSYAEEKEVPITTVILDTKDAVNFGEIDLDGDIVINEDNRTEVVGEDKTGDEKLPVIADINESGSLEPLGGSKTHEFTMSDFYGGEHSGFTTKISNVSSSRRIDYKVVIEEGDEIIFSKSFSRDVTLKTRKSKNNRDYKITIINNSNASLNYELSVQSYR